MKYKYECKICLYCLFCVFLGGFGHLVHLYTLKPNWNYKADPKLIKNILDTGSWNSPYFLILPKVVYRKTNTCNSNFLYPWLKFSYSVDLHFIYYTSYFLYIKLLFGGYEYTTVIIPVWSLISHKKIYIYITRNV